MKRTTIFICTLILIFLCSYKNAVNSKNIKTINWEKRQRQQSILINKINAPNGVHKEIYIHYLAYYGPEWSNYQVTSKKTLAVLKKYFNETPYRVIWHWDVDGCGYNDYLAVEVHPEIRRGIKRGLLVDENGKVKMYIDTIKGVYAPDYLRGGVHKILELKKLGIKENELACYAIGYITPQKKGEGMTHYGITLNTQNVAKFNKLYEKQKEERRRRGLVQMSFLYGGFELQRIDKNLKVMGTEYLNINAAYRTTDFIQAEYIPEEKRAIFNLITGSFGLEEHYHYKKGFVTKYRIAKIRGLTFSPPERINPYHVDIALKIRLLY